MNIKFCKKITRPFHIAGFTPSVGNGLAQARGRTTRPFHTAGFTMFLAVLIASLALSVGLAIYDLTIRELNLANISRQSQIAIYAADTGVECSLYWDRHNDTNSGITDIDGSAFASSSNDQTYATEVRNCIGQNINSNTANSAMTTQSAWNVVSTPSAATTTFWISMNSAGWSAANPCVQVTVAKYGTPMRTTINSRGYDTCIVNAPLRVERRLDVYF